MSSILRRKLPRPRPLDFDTGSWDRLQKLDEIDENAILIAVADNNVPKLRELVERCVVGEMDINDCYPEFGSALQLAVMMNDVTAVDILLDGGSSPWATCASSHPPSSAMLAAIDAGSSFMLQRLCKYAKLGDNDWSRWQYGTMLRRAAYAGHPSIVEDILSRCPEWPEDTGDSLLASAATSWHSPVVRLALGRFQYSSSTLDKALRRAADFPIDLLDEPPRAVRGVDYLQQQEVISLLIDAGADPSRCRDIVTNTATWIDMTFALKTLLERGADANERGGDGNATPLHHLGRPVHVARGPKRTLHETGIRLLPEHGADVLARDTVGNTPLHYAAFGSSLRLLRLLITKLPADAAINITTLRNNTGETLLHWAAAGKNYEIVAYLLSSGADVDCINDNGWTPLLCAVTPSPATVIKGSGTESYLVAETAKLLLEHGADPLARSAEAWTVLHCLAAHLDAEKDSLLAKLAADLVARGCPVMQRAAMPPPPAFSSCHRLRIDNLEVGIWGSRAASYLASATRENSGGNSTIIQDTTPLHWASVYGALGTAAVLKAHGANMQAKDIQGQCPFDLALQSQHLTAYPYIHANLQLLLAPAAMLAAPGEVRPELLYNT